MRSCLVLIGAALASLALAACGSEDISLSESDANYEGAVLFAERCGGCHTISAAGTQGSGNRTLRIQGPNFDQREESYDDVLFAIRNGGFSGVLMPQNIVVGDDAEKVAQFVSDNAGGEVEESIRPSPAE